MRIKIRGKHKNISNKLIRKALQWYARDTTMNGAFTSNLDEFILDHPHVALWTHGHTHHTFDYAIGDTRIVCNPHGYPGEKSGFDPGLVVEI